MMEVDVNLIVNGRAVQAHVEPMMSLVQLLREKLRLTGTHVGCDTAQCGACTILVDGRAVKSCNVLAIQVDGARVTTIEGVAPADGGLHPLQAAFKRHHALQCGYCTPGMIMSALALIESSHPADGRAIAAALEGNLCRCTGYRGIVAAIGETLSRAAR